MIILLKRFYAAVLPLLPAALLATSGLAHAAAPSLLRILISADKTHFVREDSGKRFILWGFNCDRDDAGRLLEDYWAQEWARVAEDFREMKGLGANVVRVHLQLARFMEDATKPNQENLARLGRLLQLAEDSGLYLDVTGLGCYHKQNVPAWYDSMEESARWEVQARFWSAVATACKASPALFCYDLMNEPIVSGGDNHKNWLPGEPLISSGALPKKHFPTSYRTSTCAS